MLLGLKMGVSLLTGPQNNCRGPSDIAPKTFDDKHHHYPEHSLLEYVCEHRSYVQT